MRTSHVLILAASIILAGVAIGIAQVSTPAAVNGCVYNVTPPTLTDRQTAPFSCDSTGKLRVTTS